VKTSSSVPPTLRFGVFELDPRAGELRKKGMKIRLQGQPVDILAMLLERPGETITREELQKKLWPADTFVDFEQGLNNAMKRLRASLDDNAESPHFIETLPRHGYRFIGSVNGPEQPPAEEAKTTRSAGAVIRLPAFAALAVLAVAAVLVGLNVHGLRDRLFLSMFARSRIRGCLRSAGSLLTGSQVNTAGVQWTFARTGRQEHGWSSTFGPPRTDIMESEHENVWSYTCEGTTTGGWLL
jgi:DNA-binding winged helix-turn-helix (wHTH) protein